MLCGATQDGWVMVERSDKMWSTGEGNGKQLQYSCLENPMNSMKRQKDRTLKDELPRSVGAQYAIGDQWRNNSRKNEWMGPKQKQHPVADGSGDRSKVWCCKEQYCIGTWNVRSMCTCTLVTQLTLCDPVDCSTPVSSALHYSPRICSNSCPLSLRCFLSFSSQ